MIIRLGAIGDIIITTPLVRYLHEHGWEIYYNASEEGYEILKHSPRIKKIIPHLRDSVPNDQLHAHWRKLKEEYKIDRILI